MNPLEQQLATLLRQAPGEPPTTIDADALVTRAASRRRRYVAPMLAAAVVVAIAVPVAVLLTRDSGTSPTTPRVTPSAAASDPKAQAIKTAQQMLAAAAVPPGAVRVAQPPLAALDNPPQVPGALHVQRTEFWTAPGSTGAAIAYLRAHPPAGLKSTGFGSMHGPNMPTVEELDFGVGEFGAAGSASLLYSVVTFQGGVAIRADAQVFWVPNRPSWAYVPDSVTSVDVTVIRKAYEGNQGGAPTVTRALAGDAAHELAKAINNVPSAAPEGGHSCPAQFIQSSEVAVFHSPRGDLRIARLSRCAFDATVTAPPSKRQAYLQGNAFTSAVLAALGLPANYGHR